MLCAGLGAHPHKDRNKYKGDDIQIVDSSLNYLNEFDLHMGDLVLRLTKKINLVFPTQTIQKPKES